MLISLHLLIFVVIGAVNLLTLMPFDQFKSFIGRTESPLDSSYEVRPFFVSRIKYSYS